jgi:hypothetical protein
MAKRALLLGSQTGGLLGTENDLKAMVNALEPRGFVTTVHRDEEATRQGILDAYQELIKQSESGDCILVYFSGHGARAKNPDYDENNPANSPAYHQFIVPTDIYDSTDTDFRGITSHELSHLLSRLTAKTRNVTVILDCCHSALMSRGPQQFMPKALPREWYVGVTAHLQQLRAQGIDVSGRPPGNPHAVGIVACGPNQSAYEYGSDSGRRMGILTESLCIALEEAGRLENIDWRSIEVRLRERSQAVFPAQRPVIEGPVARMLFDLREVEHRDSLSVVKRDNHWILEGGRIFGINKGDQYAIMPIGSSEIDQSKRIAIATVTAVGGATSQLVFTYEPGQRDLAQTAVAFPVAKATKPFYVRLVAQEKDGSLLSTAIMKSSQLELTTEIDSAECTTARIEAGRIKLFDNTGILLFEDKQNDAEGVSQTVANLRALARAQSMRNLRGGEGPSKLDASMEITWGLVQGGEEHTLPLQGAVVHVGESVFIRVVNRGTGRVWVSLFDVGLAGKLTLLNSNLAPLGVELAPDEDYIFGMKQGKVQGQSLSWPAGLPKEQPRPESIVLLVMDREQDLRPLQQAGMRSVPRGRGSELQQLLQQVESGQMRDMNPDQPQTDLKYDVRHITFFVDPVPAVGGEKGEFLIDESPDRSVLTWGAQRGQWGPAVVPRKVAVCLTDLVVRKNRAFGASTIRVDTMAITRATSEGNPRLWQQTFRFPQVRDGEALSFGKQVIYCGEVEDFLTFGVWVSRDMKGSQDLAQLFETKLNSDNFKTSATLMAGLAVTAPQAALGVAAVSAASTLLSVGYQLLTEAVPKSIGLYTNSFLRSESYGVGRHPPRGLMEAQDFWFGYVITDESEVSA